MIYILNNGFLNVAVDTGGAQLREISVADGTQFLWKGDSRYWSDSAPVLFPYIARLYDGKYTYGGKTYEMGIHGFAAQSEFRLENINSNSVTMVLDDNQITLAQYPFHFNLSITYAICDTTLSVAYAIENRDEKMMPFAIGGHPGFNVPFCEGTTFDDYSLTFSEECTPDRIGFTEDLFLSGENKPYPLQAKKMIHLCHDLFNDDAIVLQNMAKSVTLSSSKSGKKVTVSYPDMPYLGIWHIPSRDAPYVCIEPWTSLPSRQGIVEELTCKSDMITLNPGEKYHVDWSISVSEE